MMRVVRLLMLVVWVGGLIFFVSVLAPVAFRNLPSSHEAGLVVGAALRILHKTGMVAGMIYLVAALAGARPRRWWIGPVLIVLMLGLTAGSQWGILPRMEVDRAVAGGDVATLRADHPARMDFDRLHRLSVRVEGGVLLLGIAAIVLLGLQENHYAADFY